MKDVTEIKTVTRCEITSSNEPKTSDATLCIVEKRAPVWRTSGYSETLRVFVITFAPQMPANQQK